MMPTERRANDADRETCNALAIHFDLTHRDNKFIRFRVVRSLSEGLEDM